METLHRGGRRRRGFANVVSDVEARDNIGSAAAGGDGILIDGSNENVIRDSLIVNNGPYDGIGVIAGAASNGHIIENNFILDNNIGFSPTNNQDIGIRLEPATIGTTVQGNVVENSGLDGIQVFGNSGGNVGTRGSPSTETHAKTALALRSGNP
jgi:hypothetical protein